jgi:hypothetical protein
LRELMGDVEELEREFERVSLSAFFRFLPSFFPSPCGSVLTTQPQILHLRDLPPSTPPVSPPSNPNSANSKKRTSPSVGLSNPSVPHMKKPSRNLKRNTPPQRGKWRRSKRSGRRVRKEGGR